MLEEYLAQLKSPNTILMAKRTIGAFLDEYDITREDVQEFINSEAERGLSKISLKKKLYFLRGFFSFLVAEKIIEENPATDIEIPSPRIRLQDVITIRNQAIKALVSQDIRRMDVSRLTLDDLTYNKIRIKDKYVTLTPKTTAALNKYLSYRNLLNPKSNSLFISQTGKPLSWQSFYV